MAALRKNVTLTLGLISVPIAVHTAIDDDKDTTLNTLCTVNHPATKCKASLTCPTCGNSDRSSFVKGRDNGDGTFTVVNSEQIEGITPSNAEKHTMPLTTHPAEDVAHRTLPAGKVYYLAGEIAGGSYPLLVEVVKRHPEIAFCTMWAPRSRVAMYRLGAFGDALTLTELVWPEKVRQAPVCEDELDERMIPLAEQFIEQLKEPFDPEHYKDRRTETLREFLAQAETVAGTEAEEAPTAAAPSDLLAALQAAVEGKPKKKVTKRKAS